MSKAAADGTELNFELCIGSNSTFPFLNINELKEEALSVVRRADCTPCLHPHTFCCVFLNLSFGVNTNMLWKVM